jgi:hypothetical protein
MSIELVNQDLITISISYLLLWVMIIILIAYPILKIRKTRERIRNLEKNME